MRLTRALSVLLLWARAALPAEPAQSSRSLADLAVLLLAPAGERAVVKDAGGKLHLLSVGDVLPGTRARVLQVLPDRLVVEEALPGPPARTRKVWLHDRRDARGRTIVQVLDPLGPDPPERLAPVRSGRQPEPEPETDPEPDLEPDLEPDPER
jgi:hypothetical protein